MSQALKEVHCDFINQPLLVRPKVCAEILGCSLPTIWGMIRDGSDGFPVPIKFGKNMTGIPYQDLLQWIEVKKELANKKS